MTDYLAGLGAMTVTDTDYYDLGWEAAVNGVEVLAYLDYPSPHGEDWLAGWTDATELERACDRVPDGLVLVVADTNDK